MAKFFDDTDKPSEFNSVETPDLVALTHQRYKDSSQLTSDWREEARQAYDLYAGHQWAEDDLQILKEQDRAAVTFNRSATVVDVVVGTQINNRQEVSYLPRTVGDTQDTDVYNGAGKWVRDECDAEDEETDAFQDMVICGMGWCETRIAYDEDPQGKIIEERLDPIDLFWDVGSRKKNLSDSRWRMHLKSMVWSDAVARWPKLQAEGFTGAPWDNTGDESDAREHTYPQDAYKEGTPSSTRSDARQIRVAHIQWWELQPTWLVINPESREIEELTDEEMTKLRAQLNGAEEQLDAIRRNKRIYKRAFIAGHTILEGPIDIPAEDFTLHAMTGKRDRNKNVWFGLGRLLADPQKWANKFFSQILHILNTNAKGGIMAEKDAVADTRKFEDGWSAADGVTWVNAGALTQGKIMPKPTVQIPPDIGSMLQFSIGSLREVSGVNQEVLGQAERDQPASLEYQRRQSTVTILASFFDALRKFRKAQGRVLLQYMQKFISDGRLIRITGDQGKEQYVPLNKPEETRRYDIIVDQSPSSPNQKDEVFAVLTRLLPLLKEAGVPIPPEILEYSPLPAKLAQKWMKAMTEGPQVSPEMQAQLQQLQQQLQQLQQENQQLKAKQQEKMFELQLKQQDLKASQAFKAQDAEMDTQDAARKLGLARWEAENKIELERYKAEAAAELEKYKIELNAGVASDKVALDAQLKQQEIRDSLPPEYDFEASNANVANVGAAVTKLADSMAQVQQEQAQVLAELVAAINRPKKVVRGADNLLIGVE